MKVCFNTFGCKTNQYDSALISQALAAQGMDLADDPADADWVVINTCAVTRRGEDKACQWVRRVGREYPRARIAVVGCSVEVSADRFRNLPGVRLLLGTEEKFRLGEVLAGLPPEDNRPESDGPELERSGGVLDSTVYRSGANTVFSESQARARAYVKIQDGCNNRCTYCIVPRTRGPERSRDPEEIIQEALTLENAGHHEVVLTGIHIGRYGVDRGESFGLTRLLERLLSGTRSVRFRLGSVETGELDQPLLGLLATEPRLCRHLHVPLQHGCDSVLQRMGRWYTTSVFREQVESLKARIPLIGLGTDLIAGFPGESEDEFNSGRDFVSSLPFTYFHVFPYSPRPGTVAAALPGRIDTALARERVRQLRSVSSEKNAAFRKSLTGQSLPVLLETVLPDGTLACRADNYVRMYCNPPAVDGIFRVRAGRLWKDGVWGEKEPSKIEV